MFAYFDNDHFLCHFAWAAQYTIDRISIEATINNQKFVINFFYVVHNQANLCTPGHLVKVSY